MRSPSSSQSRAERHAVYDSTARSSPMLEELVELLRYRDLLQLWAVRNITLRYKRSVLGVVWTLLEPLAMMVILSVVFSTVFRFPQKNYAVYVLTGLLLFDFFTRSTVQMIEDVAASEALFRRIYLPRSVFVVATAISYLTHWLIALIPLLALLLVVGQPLSWSLLTVLPAMALTAMFALGCGLMVATIGSFLPDVKLVYQVVLTAWFYSTPIIYPLEIVPDRWQPFFRFNPLHHLLRLVRSPIYEGASADTAAWLIATGIAFGTLLAGWWTLCHWKDAIDYSA